jgi:type I restriction enzyme M protein
VVPIEEIRAEDWTLNISSYVLPSIGAEIPSLSEAVAAFKLALTNCRAAEDRLRMILTEGGWLA